MATDSPYLFPLSPYRPSGLHQALAFLPKNILDTKNVEFARAYRLTNTTIEPLSFTVPRVNTAVFHDDIFPQTRVTWKPTLSAKDWFSGSKKWVIRYIDYWIFHFIFEKFTFFTITRFGHDTKPINLSRKINPSFVFATKNILIDGTKNFI